MNKLKTLILFVLLALVMAPLPLCAVRYLNFANYRTMNGLAGNCVNDMAVDSSGFLWVATDCGLNRFDGAVFRDFYAVNNRTASNNSVLHVTAVKGGDVVVSGYKGFFRKYDCKADSFVSVVTPNFTQTVTSVCYDGSHDVFYAHTSVGTFWNKSSSFFSLCPFLNKKGQINQCMHIDNFGNYWLLDGNSLTVYDNSNGKELYHMSVPSAKRSPSPQFISLSNNRVMACVQTNQINIFKVESPTSVSLESSVVVPFDGLRCVQRAADGSFWYASDGDGLWVTREEPSAYSAFERIHPYGADDYDFCKLYALLADNDGNVWVGTQNSGLWRYSLRSGGSFSSADLGLPNCPANDFCQLPNGNIVATCDGLGLCEFSETATSVKLYSETNGLKNRNLTSVSSDSDGRLLIASWGGGLFRGTPTQKGYTFTTLPVSGLENPSSKFAVAYRFPNGDVWAMTGGDGMYVCQNGHWKRQSLAHNDCLELWPRLAIETGKGERWLCAPNSLWKYVGGKWSLFNENWFMGSGAYAVSDIAYVDGFGLVCATDSGLFVVDEKQHLFSRYDKCPCGQISSMVVDKKDRLLATVANSIWRFDLKNGSAERYPRNFDINGRDFFVRRSAFCSRSGNVYFGTTNGFVCVAEKDFLKEQNSPLLLFSRIFADGQKIYVPEDHYILLAYGHSSLSVDVDMVDFSLLRSPLVYRLNKNENWVSMGTGQTVNFNYLPTGSYTLQVKCLDAEDGVLELFIEVEAPWWQTWWFRLFCIVLVLLIVGWKLYSMGRDRKVLQQKVQERTKELNDALSAKNRIMQVVAHDLKNPMFAIYGALEQLRMKSSSMSVDEHNSALDKVIDSTRTVQDELGKLLNWATARQDELVCHLSNVVLTDLVNAEVNLLLLQAREKNVEIVCSLNVSRYVYADARMLATALRNVLGNSLKFTPNGKKIFVNAWQESAFAVVEIKDEGVGMSPEQLDRLMTLDVNNSTRGTAGESGTGLGVGLAKQYMTAIGGAFDMDSGLGVGTTTWLRVPLAKLEVTTVVEVEKKPQVEVNVDADLLRENAVLVVDDDPLIAHNIKSMLEEYVDVTLAGNGAEALDAVAGRAFDIVVTDVDMPIMNGFELGRILQSEPDYNHIPLLFLSARSAENDRLTGLQTGAVDYITKPFSRGELLIKLNNILLLRQRQQQRLLAEIGKIPADGADSQKENDSPEKMNPYLLKVIEVIGEHFSEPDYSVESLASDMCTSHVTLYRKVKSLSGKTPLDLLTEFRLNRAHQMLSEGKTDLQDVAFKTGFPDYTYFSRKFKARFGYPPKDVSAL